ncbi:MAG: hypothetical protein ABIN67_07735 [Ferruginibacter sp.]
MSLFDFLKPKPKPVPQEVIVPSNRSECDISKTQLIVELLKIPREERDDSWYQSFYENVATASFACGSPQVLRGPDEIPYFILKTPEVNKPFESFCIQNMKDDFLLEKGWGVVFNPAEDKSADWVFTYGAIVNLHLNNKFVSTVDEADVENIAFNGTVGATKKEEQVLVAQPSDTYLPRPTRAALRSFLQSKGIKKPQVLMLTSINDGKAIRKLVFNIHPENYPVSSQLDYLMQQVGWFLPNDYILIPLPKRSELASGFHPL